MANHCNNYATLYGSKESIQEVIKRLIDNTKENPLLWWETFHKVLDLPINLDNDVYDLFGSKWFEVYIDSETEDSVTISGQSAWSPMVPFWQKLSEKFNLKIEGEYDEGGDDFGGFFTIENGTLVKNKVYNYISFRYLACGLDGLFIEFSDYHELLSSELKHNEIQNRLIEYLDTAKEVMSDEDYNEGLKFIKELK